MMYLASTHLAYIHGRRTMMTMKYESQEYWSSLIKMSLSRFFILHVLHHQAVHGYEITKKIAAITNGCCAPTEGSLYPVLREFMDSGLIEVKAEVVSGRERKVYTLTPSGERAYEMAASAWKEMAGYILSSIGLDEEAKAVSWS
jgi:PadR family transcriptional regulator, regulatory protein PadR